MSTFQYGSIMYGIHIHICMLGMDKATFLFHPGWCCRSDLTAQSQDPTVYWLFAQTSAMLFGQQRRIQDLDLQGPA